MTTVHAPPPAGNDEAISDRVARRQDAVRDEIEDLIADLADAVRRVQDLHAAEWSAGGHAPGQRARRVNPTPAEKAAADVDAAKRQLTRANTLLGQAEAHAAFVAATSRLRGAAYMVWPDGGLCAPADDLPAGNSDAPANPLDNLLNHLRTDARRANDTWQDYAEAMDRGDAATARLYAGAHDYARHVYLETAGELYDALGSVLANPPREAVAFGNPADDEGGAA